MGPITVRDALVQSKNVVTAEVAQTVGLANVARLAEKAGLTKVPQVPSLALGVAEATPLQMASAYTSFANRGRRIAPISVKRVTTKDGATLFESHAETRDVMSPQVAYILTTMMQDVLDRGTGSRVRQMGFTGVAAGKTGSSRDAWFAGYTPNLVCVVYVGFDDNSDIKLTGGVIAAPIWADFMIRALKVRPELGGSFEDPGGLVVCDIDPTTGVAPSEASTGSRREIFLAGTEPTGAQPLPEVSVPGVDPTSTADGASQSPKSPDDNGRASAGVTTGIPLPPDARRPETRPEVAPSQKWSFGAKLKDFLGLGSAGKPKPTPTPTPTPKPTEEGALQSRRQFQGSAQASTPRTTPTLKPVAFNTVRATGVPIPAVTPKPKPPPQVATRPRRVAERKQSEKFVAKVPGNSRGAPLNKDKSAANKNNEKKSAEKAVPRNNEKRLAEKTVPRNNEKRLDQRAEIKAAVKQREKTSDQEPKSLKPTPTPSPSPKPSPTVAAIPAVVHSVPKGEGTFMLEVCAVSGLLPVRGVCKNTVRQRFKLGGEPTKFCNLSHR
jgi:membrane peptidoglycan carboxypeptidase